MIKQAIELSVGNLAILSLILGLSWECFTLVKQDVVRALVIRKDLSFSRMIEVIVKIKLCKVRLRLGLHIAFPRHKQRSDMSFEMLQVGSTKLSKVEVPKRHWEHSSIALGVEERTLKAFEALDFLAGLSLVHQGMELLFFPAVAKLA